MMRKSLQARLAGQPCRKVYQVLVVRHFHPVHPSIQKCRAYSTAPKKPSFKQEKPTIDYDPASPWNRHLSEAAKLRRPSKLKAIHKYAGADISYLGGGLPHPSNFPFKTFFMTVPSMEDNEMTYLDTLDDMETALQYSGGEGNDQLRAWLWEHTEKTHKPPYKDHGLIMTSSATDALDKTLRMLLNPGDTLLVDEILYSITLDMLAPMGIKPVGIEMDEHGMKVSALKYALDNWPHENKPRVICLIPYGQNPTGTSLPSDRKRDIYELAVKHDLIIIEDDPYFFLQLGESKAHEKAPMAAYSARLSAQDSMLSYDRDGRVIRLDSLSKIIVPGLRLGYITANPFFLERLTRHNEVTVQSASGISQLFALRLLKYWGFTGFTKWLKVLSDDYTLRKNSFEGLLNEYFPQEICSWTTPTAGMFFWFSLDVTKHPLYGTESVAKIMDDLWNDFIKEGVVVVPGKWFATSEVPDDQGRLKGDTCFRATYAFESKQQMEVGVQKMGRVIKQSFAVI